MAADGRIHDGHTFIFGMDADTEPSALDASVAAKAVNRAFRGGRNRTRPPFIHKQFIFDDESMPYMDVLLHGNIQGAFPYRRYAPGRADGIIVSVAGHLFHLTIVNDRFSVRCFWTQNNPTLLHSWMEQAGEWVYVQDGEKEPVFWDGLYPSTARRSLGNAGKEMPVGTIMRYIHGRMFVSNAFDQIAASDIMYGDGMTTTKNVQRFTENTYWSEGGFFGTPTNLGTITGMLTMRRVYKGGLRGEGELLIMSLDGAQIIEAGTLRAKWKDEQVQSISLMGRGGVSPYSLINVNNDAFFRSDDGLSSYRLAMSDTQNGFSFSKISSQVNNWMEDDTPEYLQFTNSIYFDNRVLTTVSPFLQQSSDTSIGAHHYSRGIVALDLDRASRNRGDQDFNYDGLWTGIRPVSLIKARLGDTIRAFAFSHDEDGVNRMYEIARKGRCDQIDGTNVKTKWFYMSKKFTWLPTMKSNDFEVKKLVGGEVWVSDVSHRIKIEAEYRPDYALGWYRTMKEQEFGSEPAGWEFTQPRYRRFKFDTPEAGCLPGAPFTLPWGAAHQIKIKGEGAVQIDRMRIAMAAQNAPNTPVGTCNEPEDSDQTILDTLDENDYAYSIVRSKPPIVDDNAT